MILWPILGSLKECPLSRPFPIAIYSSTKKPTPLDEYLNDFVSEMNSLKQYGFLFNGKTYIVKIDAVICDAPARAFIKCTRPNSAYNSCERCMQRGKWCNKVTLPNLEAPPITDLTFIERHYSDHHVGSSPLEHLGCGMVTEFPLEYIHLVCLGVMRRLLFQWIHGPRGDCKPSQLQLSMIPNSLAVIRKHIPREFSTKPRSLSECKKWKATELRQFLLYTGPVVLKTILKDTIYSNFLDLSVAIRILLSPNLLSKNIAYAEQLLKYFVVTFSKLYGENQQNNLLLIQL